METDLKLICDAIPVSSSGTVSTQASAILKGVTGADVEFNIQTGGSQPTLNSPQFVEGVNIVAITNPSTNGNFSKQLKVTDNGVVVYQSSTTLSYTHTVTESDDGKVLEATLSGDDFNDSVANCVMNYISPGNGLNFSDKAVVRGWPGYTTKPIFIELSTQLAGNSPTVEVKIGTYTKTLNSSSSYNDFRVILGYRDVDSTEVYIDENIEVSFKVTSVGAYSIFDSSGRFYPFRIMSAGNAPSGWTTPTSLPASRTFSNASQISLAAPTVNQMTVLILDTNDSVISSYELHATKTGNELYFWSNDVSQAVYVTQGQKAIVVGTLSW